MLLYVTAHTTQFTQVGWTYLKHGAGSGKLDNGGSYVSLLGPKKDLTVIIETMVGEHLCYPAWQCYQTVRISTGRDGDLTQYYPDVMLHMPDKRIQTGINWIAE
jgi:hypothetical protein